VAGAGDGTGGTTSDGGDRGQQPLTVIRIDGLGAAANQDLGTLDVGDLCAKTEKIAPDHCPECSSSKS
jgi:hypothetical protein